MRPDSEQKSDWIVIRKLGTNIVSKCPFEPYLIRHLIRNSIKVDKWL